MNNKYSVSIAMCTYNGEKYIEEQLNSILAQTRKPDELVICDDRSTDNTITIINHFKNEAPFEVRLFQNLTQLGSTKNFEKAVTECTGDLIFFADQDDVWEKEKIQVMEQKFLESPNASIVITDADMVNQDLISLGYSLWESIPFTKEEQNIFQKNSLDVLLKKNVITGATMAVKSESINKTTPFPNKWIHDAWVAMIVASMNDGEIILIDDNMIKYRQHSNNQLGAKKRNLAEQVNEAKKKQTSVNLDFDVVEAFLNENDYKVPTNNLMKIKGKNSHVKLRNNLPSSKIGRLGIVLTNLSGYHKYSNGLKSVLKDIFY
ncbi:glycosyltransferase family 2 protein [Litchfieldia salsa]|uniref:Glycosyl transferase family 2 n=1 Tax=Litchfieldia salsa TaxID=930152 RepID=A0A1H0WVV7_9BACI|nr:glycosyltransferase family 2 protein [Litchfieldia salsa]SDP94904.1 Glycosyl transferase family 2 [Litchfieldia salsa]